MIHPQLFPPHSVLRCLTSLNLKSYGLRRLTGKFLVFRTDFCPKDQD
jgi:hypothetical protein